MTVANRHFPVMAAVLFTAASLMAVPAAAEPMVKAYNPVIPVIVDRTYNIITELEITAEGTETLEYVDFKIEGLPASAVASVRLMHSGTLSCLLTKAGSDRDNPSVGLKIAYRELYGGQKAWYDPSYVNEKVCVKPGKTSGKETKVRLKEPVKLVKGNNYCYVSMEVRSTEADLAKTFKAEAKAVCIDGKRMIPAQAGPSGGRRLGVLVRNAGAEGVHTYRIPSLVTTKDGTLLAMFELRHNNYHDLPEDIDIAVARSTDGGRTWSNNIMALDMGRDSGLPQSQNGVTDACMLVDPQTGRIFIEGHWCCGALKGQFRRRDGLEHPVEWMQKMLVFSDDDGCTWSEPENLAYLVRPGKRSVRACPGRGICMSDGTLVFPFHHLDSNEKFDGNTLAYSKDHGKTWRLSPASCGHGTTEAQIAEIKPGTIMITSRLEDKKRRWREVYTTSDLGATWTEHPSSRKLPDPNCMASILSAPAAGSQLLGGSTVNGSSLKNDVLLFCNCASTKRRLNKTVRASIDGGLTWSDGLLLDEGRSLGYSCMTMIDGDTVGVLYESSTGHLVFQKIPLKDIVKQL